MVDVYHKESLMRSHMIEVASEMIVESGSASFRIADLAQRANVGVPTIYYHFESRTQIIAEAQMANYFKMTVPLHRFLSNAETALSTRDEAAFWKAIRDNMLKAWSSGAMNDKMGIVKLLLDVHLDEKSRELFRDRLDIQFARLVAVFWSASIGQIITVGSKFIDVSPHDAGAFLL